MNIQQCSLETEEFIYLCTNYPKIYKNTYWGYFYLLLSDNEIRFGNSSVMQAFKQSFSPKILSIAGFFVLYVLIQISVSLIFGLIFFMVS